MNITKEVVQPFYLLRTEDVSGSSGVGVVAIGAILPSGCCVMEWCTFHSSLGIYRSLTDIDKIHNHGGKTQIIMGNPDEK